MKAFRILGRNIKDSFKGVFRNFSLSIASISCITITLILVGFSIILSYNVNRFTADIEKDITIVVFLDNDVTNVEADMIGDQIGKLPNIESVNFKSKESVRQDWIKEDPTLEGVLSQYDASTNPLQDSYLVKVKDIEMIGDTADRISIIDGVYLAKYGEGTVEELVNIFDVVKKVMYVVVVALVLVTAFLISNTIKITIQSRKREIEIMRLVGASNMYIKLPFFFEGILLGFIGSVIPMATCFFGYDFLYEKLGGQLFTPIIKLVKPSEVIYITVLVLVAVGVVVGAFGSYRAVKKHLKI